MAQINAEQLRQQFQQNPELKAQALQQVQAMMGQTGQEQAIQTQQPQQKFNLGGAILGGLQGLSQGVAGKPFDLSSIHGKTTEPSFYQKELFKSQLKGLEPKTTKPKIQTVGDKILSIDPESGAVSEIYTSPEKEKSATEIKAEMDLQESERKKQFASDQVKLSAEDTLKTIGEVEKGLDMATGFGTWGDLPSIPGSSRRTWEAYVDKLISTNILNVMTTLKEASKTGSTGFGQLSEKELKVLMDASTALKKTLNRDDAKKILDDMKVKMKKILSEKNSANTDQPKIEQVETDPLGIR